MHKYMIVALVLIAAGCGDSNTNDHRGYTKAPLEEPKVLVKAEHASDMVRYGEPNLPEAPLIEAEKESKEAPAGPTGGTAAPVSAGKAPAGATATDVQEGQKIFTSTGNCYTCHGQTGGGTAMAPALNDQKWMHVDGSWEQIQKIVHAGVPKPKEHPAPMPAMGGASLSDAQVKQVAAYVYSVSHK